MKILRGCLVLTKNVFLQDETSFYYKKKARHEIYSNHHFMFLYNAKHIR